MKRIPFALLGISLAGMLALSACSSTNQTAGTNTTGQGITDAQSGSGQTTEQAGVLSSFSATDLDGNTVDQSVLADYDLTMVNVWATFCTPCLSEMPELGQLQQEYQEKGVQIIGIVMDVYNSDGSLNESQVEKARLAVEQTGADYLHLLPSKDLIAAKLKDVSAVPETFFVDAQGNLVGDSYLGARDKAGWQQVIEEKLEELA